MNNHYKALRALLSALSGTDKLDVLITDALELAGHQVSKSALQGWRVAEGTKNYRPMSKDDLLMVMRALVDYFNSIPPPCIGCGYKGLGWLDDGETCPRCKLVQ